MSYTHGDYAACLSEWTDVLREKLTPIVYGEFAELYLESCKYVEKMEKEQKKRLSTHDVFHVLLDQIPDWNGKIVKEYAEKITNKIPKIRALLRNVCVSLIYVLSAVRLGTGKSSTTPVDATIPALETFVHTLFETCSREILEDVYLFDHKESSDRKRKNKKHVLDIVAKAISACIRQLMNVEKVLDPYLQEVMEEKEYTSTPPTTSATPAPTPEAPPVIAPQPALVAVAAPPSTSQAVAQTVIQADALIKALDVKEKLDILEAQAGGDIPIIEVSEAPPHSSHSSHSHEAEDEKKTIHIPVEMMKYSPQPDEIIDQADAPFDFSRWAEEAEEKI